MNTRKVIRTCSPEQGLLISGALQSPGYDSSAPDHNSSALFGNNDSGSELSEMEDLSGTSQVIDKQ